MARKSKREKEFDNIFQKLDEDTRSFAQPLIDEFFFMEKILKELKKDIEEAGAVIKTQNGNGFLVYMENPAKKSYDAMFKNYSATWNKLCDLLPKENGSADELMDFLNAD